MRHHDHPEAYRSGTTIVRKRLSFFSVVALCFAGIVVTVVVCASAIAFRGLTIVDRKADSLTQLATDLVKALPEYRAALPPALADAIDDERQPGYIEQVKIDARLIETTSRGQTRGVVEVTNSGDEVVSLLSLRVVGLDRAENPVWEHSTWGATPIQIDDDWRGPLLPGTTRRIPIRTWHHDGATALQCEVTDLRVWKGKTPEALTAARN